MAEDAVPKLALASLVFSAAWVVPLAWVWLDSGSVLAMAQTADSAADAVAAGALAYSVRLARRPPDEHHPRGHRRAEPIAALVASVLVGVLALEVFRDAIMAIVDGASPEIGATLAVVLAVKVVAKAGLTFVAQRVARGGVAPAARVIEVDARNDVLIGLLSLGAFAAVHFGTPRLDAWLALPIALYIGWSGFELAAENVQVLMGEAASDARHDELTTVTESVEGVRSAHDLVARREGTALDVTVHVVVDPEQTVRQAHDIAVAVQEALEAEPDVAHAMVHVDADA